MGLNLSTHQIAAELDLNKDDVQQMTSQLRTGIVEQKPEVLLSGEVELDELYGKCWLQRSANSGEKKGRLGRSRRLKTKPGRGTLAQEKPPIFGMMQRGGEVIIRMLSNVKQQLVAGFLKSETEILNNRFNGAFNEAKRSVLN